MQINATVLDPTTVINRSLLLDQVIKMLGFEHELTIEFAHAIERADRDDYQINFLFDAIMDYGYILNEE